VAQDRDQWRAVMNKLHLSGFIKGGKFLEQLSDYQLLCLKFVKSNEVGNLRY
jgi:hypothetical protein